MQTGEGIVVSNRLNSITFVSCAVVFSIAMVVSAYSETTTAKNLVKKAESMIDRLATTCQADIRSYCPKVTPGDGRMALCILAHEDQISDSCYGEIFDAVKKIGTFYSSVRSAASACDSDIERVCGHVELGQGRIAQCLIDNKSKLAAGCRATIVKIESRFKN